MGIKIITKLHNDRYWMCEALKYAYAAVYSGEVPIGAVLVLKDKLLGAAYNQVVGLCDPTAHAEVLVIRASAKHIRNYRIINSTLYVTIEPCPMCAGAIILARIGRVVFGANKDTSSGVTGDSIFNILQSSTNHQINVVGGILSEECQTLISNFFIKKRNYKKYYKKIILERYRSGYNGADSKSDGGISLRGFESHSLRK